ncbi:hypothetical protein BU17DRAFT_89774 [Hysterangium stoloniferum]|nr:hypothetical protein BU17DRAFT_89774 [Hysterangium stoloniferum]
MVDPEDYLYDNGQDDPSFSKPPLKKRRHDSPSVAGNSSRAEKSSIKFAQSRNTSTTKKTRAQKNRKEGRLSKLLEMPMDIFCEISSHLEPVDLLHLARSTKSFHNMLMSRNSRSIWRISRSASFPDLPDCPPDLTEAQYTQLIFERDCHNCLVSRTLKVDNFIRVRLCRNCWPRLIISGTEALKRFPDLSLELLYCIPYRHEGSWRKISSPNTRKFYVKTIEILMRNFHKVVPDSLREDQREAVSEAFKQSQKDLLKEIENASHLPFVAFPFSHIKYPQHSIDLDQWLQSQSDKRSRQGCDAAMRRRKQIHKQLLGHGYIDDDLDITLWSLETLTKWEKFVTQPRDLTPRIWKTILPKLEALIADGRLERSHEERITRKITRQEELMVYIQPFVKNRQDLDKRLFIPLPNVWTLPAIVGLIREDDYNISITEERWLAFKDQAKHEMDEFAVTSQKQMLQLIMDSDSGMVTQGTTPFSKMHEYSLQSPWTYFICRECQLSYMIDRSPQWRYPELLHHRHNDNDPWNSDMFRFNAIESFIGNVEQKNILMCSVWASPQTNGMAEYSAPFQANLAGTPSIIMYLLHT